MRLLLFSDLHRDARAARALVERAPSVDVLVGAGDFGSVRRGLADVLDVLRAVERPLVLVPGNAESVDELREACAGWELATVLHGDGATVAGRAFHGLGGAVPVTPFGDWSYDFTEDQARELLADCPAGAVLVSHSPPKGAVDVSSSGQSLGSEAVRELILARQPALVVCGHIHHCAGRTETLGDTPVVNAGPAGVVWELPAC